MDTITKRNEVIFGDWDPSADGDMAAIRSIFDTNHNGQLDVSRRLLVGNRSASKRATRASQVSASSSPTPNG